MTSVIGDGFILRIKEVRPEDFASIDFLIGRSRTPCALARSAKTLRFKKERIRIVLEKMKKNKEWSRGNEKRGGGNEIS